MIRHFALALLLAVPVAAQPAAHAAATIPARRAFEHTRHVRMEYHAPSRWTIVALEPLVLGPDGRTELRTSFRFPGHAPANAPGTVTFALVSRGARTVTTPIVGKAAANKSAIALVLDGGAPLALTASRFARDVSGDTTETTTYATIPRATFLRLTSAQTAEIRLGDRSWTLAPDMLEGLRDLASRLSPAGYRAAKSEKGMVAAAEAEPAGAGKVWPASEVSTMAKPRGLLVRPRFPVDAVAAKRRVYFRYVVDTTGIVDVSTLRGESPTADSLFVESLRTAAGRWLFVPARKEGRAVRVEVRQVFEFVPGQ